MKQLIDWLITVEHLAHEFYSEAAVFFADDPELKSFLSHLASDEADHYHIVNSAAQYLSAFPARKPQINVDDSIKENIEGPLRRGLAKLKGRSITKEAVLDLTVDSEISEWNDLLLYVLDTLKSKDRIFEHAASRIEQHVRSIEYYLNSSATGREKLKRLKKIPYAGKERILIVDDELAIASLVAKMLDEICESDLAENGEQALAMIRQTPYSLIISDLDMPVMGGLELYRQAASYLAKPNEMFLFHSGNIDAESQAFFERNDIQYLLKPSSIIALRDTVLEKFRITYLAVAD